MGGEWPMYVGFPSPPLAGTDCAGYSQWNQTPQYSDNQTPQYSDCHKFSCVGDHTGKRRGRRRCQLLIATHLNALEDEDPACVVYVRNTQKLGFGAVDLVRAYFEEQFGPVEKVLGCSAPEKLGNAPFPVRVRPSGIVLLLMRDPRDAAAILAAGQVHNIDGVPVVVRPFLKRSAAAVDSRRRATSAAQPALAPMRPRTI